jgi:hypothetical protein
MKYRLDLPFKLPGEKAARAVASASYWRAADERARKALKDPKVRELFIRLGVLKPQS